MKRPPEYLTNDEAERLIDGCSRCGLAGIRDRAALLLLYRGCLRISECLDLRVSDVDIKKGTVRVLHGKNDKARTVGLPQSVCDAIERWLQSRDSVVIGRSGILFCGISKQNAGQRLDNSHYRHKLAELKVRAGIDKRVHPHGMRHSGAVRLYLATRDVRLVQKILGHSSLSTTQIYLDSLSPMDVIEAMRRE